MKKHQYLTIVSLFIALMILWGCEPSDPGSPLGNIPPDTKIIVAPDFADSVQHHEDHYVSPSPMFHLQWFGFDPDGQVEGYWLTIDNRPTIWITSGDTAIAFESSERDPNNPSRTLPQEHVFRVAAVDNEGAVDETPAEKKFPSTNYVPNLRRLDSDFENQDTVGQDIYFEVVWNDSNPSGAEFHLTIDGTEVMFDVSGASVAWSPNGKFHFCNTNDPSILASIDQGSVQPVDISYLTAGNHDIVAKVRDLGMAESDPETLTIYVDPAKRPVTTELKAMYGSREFYDDGSIYFKANTPVSFTMAGDASEYYGSIQGFRYRMGNDWSPWGPAEISLPALEPGTYSIEAQCRDFAGKLGDTLSVDLSIVEPDIDGKTILIVDETRNGNGRAGSPNDAQCDSFYCVRMTPDLIADGWDIISADVDSTVISPKIVHDRRIIIWHADDKSDQKLSENIKILQEYLTKGGRLILSGWNVLGPFAGEAEEITASSGFLKNQLRLNGGKLRDDKAFIGMRAVEGTGYSRIHHDPDKISSRWDGVDECWILYPRHRTDVAGTFSDFEENPEYEGYCTLHHNFHPAIQWKTITLGFPLYFIFDDEARALLNQMVSNIHQ